MPQTIRISKPLFLFSVESGDLEEPKLVPRGTYKVQRVADPRNKGGKGNKGGKRWLRIMGQPWGNAEACWYAMAHSSTKSGPIIPPWLQLPGLLVVLVCFGLLTNGRTSARASAKAAADLPALRMELSGLENQLQNVTNHYPLLLAPIQSLYRNRYEAAIYASAVYPRYSALRQARQQAALQAKPELQEYFATMNGIDDELYRAWHTWSNTDRSAAIAGIEKKREQILTTGIMATKEKDFQELPDSGLSEPIVAATLEFNEHIESEIGDADPALKAVARQNRDCAERAIKLRVRIKALNEEIAKASRPSRSFFSFARS
jgi:hypothetical protein